MSNFHGHYRSGNFEVRHLRCVGSITKIYCVIHTFRQTTRTRATAKKPTSGKTAHPVETLLCYNIRLYQWDLQHFKDSIA